MSRSLCSQASSRKKKLAAYFEVLPSIRRFAPQLLLIAAIFNGRLAAAAYVPGLHRRAHRLAPLAGKREFIAFQPAGSSQFQI